MLTSTPGYSFVLGEFDFHRGMFRARVRTIAKRLRLGSATPTPIILAGLHLQHVRHPLRNHHWISHSFPPCICFVKTIFAPRIVLYLARYAPIPRTGVACLEGLMS